MKIRTIEIGKQEYLENGKPCIYEVFLGDTCLYVGQSAYGFARLYTISANQPGRKNAFAAGDRIVVSFYETDEECRLAEETLIHARHPHFNEQCAKCGRLLDIQKAVSRRTSDKRKNPTQV